VYVNYLQALLRLPAPAERRRLREAAGLSVKALADALAVDAADLRRWERTRPDADSIDGYLAALDLLRAVEPGSPAYTRAEVQDFLSTIAKERCTHCGGRHSRACPRVRSMEFDSSGRVLRVEFWPDGRWSTDHVLFADELPDPDSLPDTLEEP
jgi:hypothetical protein